MTLSEKFARLVGIEWHEIKKENVNFACTCRIQFKTYDMLLQHVQNLNPDFSDPREVLKVMMAREDFKLFMARLEYGDFPNVDAIDWSGHIDLDYITEPNKLLKAAVEWRKKER